MFPKVLSLNREINFFTGHSGSGKSTVIDAMQLVLCQYRRPGILQQSRS
ncbi:MAG: ATP-binding protein [Clostridium sp.]